MFTLTQWSSLQKSISKFAPKKFCEIDPRWQRYKTFLGVIYATIGTLLRRLRFKLRLKSFITLATGLLFGLRQGACGREEHLTALALLANIRIDWKGLPGTNEVDYLAFSSVTKKKSFITLTTGVNVTKLFFVTLTVGQNKLDCSIFSRFIGLV